MLKIEKTETYCWEAAIRGMRNPMNSWDRSDTVMKNMVLKANEIAPGVTAYQWTPCMPFPVIGPNDYERMKQLRLAGDEHAKLFRMIIVTCDITAPLYWWKEFDTYKVGTTANSTSTMHKLASTPITAECFEIDDYNSDLDYDGTKLGDVIDKHIEFLESMRVKYLETKDKAYWKELIRWLPSAWQQTRTVTMTYENLLAMCSKGQRRFHKLTEWSKSFIDWARTLPYAQELIFPDETE